MGMKEPWMVKQLVRATQQLHAARLHERFSDHDCFLIRSPKLDAPAVGVLMGYGGITTGLSVFLGPDAITSYRAVYGGGGGAQSQRAAHRATMIGYQVCDPSELTHDARRWLKKAKVRPERSQLYPDPMAMEPGKVPRVVLKDRQTRLLLHLVRGLLAASADEAFMPNGFDANGRVLCLQLDDDIENPTTTITWETGGGAEQATSPATPQTSAPTPRFDLSGLECSGDSWLVALLPVPGIIVDDDRQPYLLIVGSEMSECVWPTLLMDSGPSDLIDALAGVMRDDQQDPPEGLDGLVDTQPPPTGRPKQMILATPELFSAARPAFEPLGIACFDGSNNPELQAAIDELLDDLDWDGLDEDVMDGAALDATHVPAADDIHGWKEVDGWLKEMIHHGFNYDDRYHGNRALRRYFGSDAEPDTLLDRYQGLMVVDSYAHWFAIHYRSARNRPTLAEQWLKNPELPKALYLLIEAAAAHGPSLYRVQEADEDTGKITFEDLFTGELTIATDFALSTCAETGYILPAKLVPVGDYHFYFAAGPVIMPRQISVVMDFFEAQNIDPSPKFFRKKPHVLGWLWDEIDQYQREGVNVGNTDGHALAFHTAIFRYDDRSALQRWLDQREDMAPQDDDGAAWSWFRPDTAATPKARGGSHRVDTHQGEEDPITILGHLDMNDGTATFTTNSRERFESFCPLLESIDGVTLESVEVEDATSQFNREDDPATETTHPAAPEPLDDEALAQVRAYMENYYRRWLDEPIPALNDKTPREAAKSPKLRPRLAAMVRAMPDPVNASDPSVQINAPREMLMAELGLNKGG